MLLATLFLGWRALQVAMQPLPVPPPFSPPPMADRALLARLDPFFPVRADLSGALPVTALPLSLHGVRSDSATGRGSAIIASGDGVQKVFSVGETLAAGVQLVGIAADHVVIARDGVREALWLDAAGAQTVQRYDPNAFDPMEAPADDADGNRVGPSDAPAPAPPPSAALGGAAMMPAVPRDSAERGAP